MDSEVHQRDDMQILRDATAQQKILLIFLLQHEVLLCLQLLQQDKMHFIHSIFYIYSDLKTISSSVQHIILLDLPLTGK